jgi:beta-N-acetylhexosaminidase
MVSHVMFTQLDADYPATLSPALTRTLLREDIGFDGVAATDCMEMKAIADHYGPGEAAVLAVLAGIDLVMYSHTRAWQAQAFEAVLAAVESGRISESRLDQSLARIQAMKQRYAVVDRPVMETIRRPSHLALAERAARAGVLAVKRSDALLPLQPDQPLVCVEFTSQIDSGVIDSDAPTQFSKLLHQRLPALVTVTLDPALVDHRGLDQALALLDDHAVLVVATRNAHLYPEQTQAAQSLIDQAEAAILLCLRNPYDASVLSGAEAVFCTHGDSSPSLQAAVAVLCGDFVPTAQAVVPL